MMRPRRGVVGRKSAAPICPINFEIIFSLAPGRARCTRLVLGGISLDSRKPQLFVYMAVGAALIREGKKFCCGREYAQT